MKLCYLVYREDNVMVYESQVLEYLRAMKAKNLFETIELIVFRHEQNLTKRDVVEARIHKYIDCCVSFWSFPVLSVLQLDANASRLFAYLKKSYSKDDQIAVICRGDLAAYVGVKAFRGFNNSRILYDNRGLAYEESVMSHKKNIIHTINRNAKRNALDYAKNHVDMYNFVTGAMRQFFLEQYGYNDKCPYTVIPTLYHVEERDAAKQKEINLREGIGPGDFVVSYVGSTAAWQSTHKLIQIIKQIGERYNSAKFIILSNGTMAELDLLPESIKNRLVIKSVPHDEMKYYLHLTDIGIVIRDNNIVNKVAAPTKIAEYLTSGILLLYSGDIGILDDLSRICGKDRMICIETETGWIEQIDPYKAGEKLVDPKIKDYFDMDKRQMETFEMICQAFENQKVM